MPEATTRSATTTGGEVADGSPGTSNGHVSVPVTDLPRYEPPRPRSPNGDHVTASRTEPAPERRPSITQSIRAHRRRIAYISAYGVAGVVDLVVTIGRLRAASGARYSGHADASFYYQFARNLAQGRGPTVDFIWHFLVQPPSVHHYAADYWQPLPSTLMAWAMRSSGSTNVAVAVRTVVLAAALIPLATVLLARALNTHPLVPPLAAAVVAVNPMMSGWSVQTESVVFYGLFVPLALALACAQWTPTVRWLRRSRWPLAGAAAAAAYLCRNDGLLLVVLIGGALAGRVALRALRAEWRQAVLRLADLGAYAAGALVLLVPWIAANERGMGRPVPPTSELPFLNSFEDIFAIDNRVGFHDLTASGLDHAMSMRSAGLSHQGHATILAVGRVPLVALAVVLLLCGWLLLIRWRHLRWQPGQFSWGLVAGGAAAVFGFHTLVSPVASGGAWARSVVAFIPALVIGILQGLHMIGRSRLLCLAMAVAIAWQWYPAAARMPARTVVYNNDIGSSNAELRSVLLSGAPDGPIVMTRSPWEMTEATGFPTVQIPNNDLCTIIRTAWRYGVNLIVLPARREALRSSVVLHDTGFTPVGRAGSSAVYRVPPVGGPCRPGP